MNETLLELKNIDASIENKQIIKDFNLTIKKNEIHVIMGPNGSGDISNKFCSQNVIIPLSTE